MSFYLVVGLGNPGPQYERTRHNVGFHVVQEIAKKYKAPAFKKKKKALYSSFTKEEKEIYLLMPQTYMNLSGEAVKKWVKYLKIPKERLLVIVDDAEIPFGKVRLKPKGSSGGHNGLEDIETLLGSQDYPRLRVGIGKPKQGDLADFVLEPFSEKEEQELPKITEKVVEATLQWIEEGTLTAMNTVNK